MSEEEGKEIIVRKSDTFTEKFVTTFIVTHAPDDYFVLDFGKPVLDAYAEEKSGKILGHKGELQLEVRLYLTAKSTRDMLKALKKNLEKYDKKK